jgi:hypothetical protein
MTMKIKSITNLVVILLAFCNILFAQPPKAVVSDECQELQNALMSINSANNTFNLSFTLTSPYMVWDLHQETANGDIVVNYGASDVTNITEPLNSNPLNGNYYIKAWSVCAGDGTYHGSEILSKGIFKIPTATIIEDQLICYIKIPGNNPCNPYSPTSPTMEFCKPINKASTIELIVFGCNPPISIVNGKRGVDESYGIKITAGSSFNNIFSLSSGGSSGTYIGSIFGSRNDFINRGMAAACKRIPNLDGGTGKIQKTNNNATLSPNPTTGDLTINLDLPTATAMDIRVLNIQGQQVMILNNQEKTESGKYVSTFDVSELHAGLYFLEIRTNEDKFVHKFMKN